jgi:hypothetical protein
VAGWRHAQRCKTAHSKAILILRSEKTKSFAVRCIKSTKLRYRYELVPIPDSIKGLGRFLCELVITVTNCQTLTCMPSNQCSCAEIILFPILEVFSSLQQANSRPTYFVFICHFNSVNAENILIREQWLNVVFITEYKIVSIHFIRIRKI